MPVSSLLKNALTPDEQRLIPGILVSKMDEEMRLYESECLKKTIEFEKKVERCEEVIADMTRRNIKQEIELTETRRLLSMTEMQREQCFQENACLKGEINSYRDKTGDSSQYFVKESEVEKLKKAFEEQTEEMNRKCAELERSNIRLADKILEQKKQMKYLVNSSEVPEASRDNLELIKLIQKLTKRNEELERWSEVSTDRSRVHDGADIKEEYKKKCDELNEMNRRGCMLEIEYNKVFKEKGEMESRVAIEVNEKKIMQRYMEEMKEEMMCLKIELGNVKAKNAILGDASLRLSEMNSEIVRCNLIMKEDRNRIRELKSQVVECEERYNKYILEERTTVTAIIGREIEGIKKSLGEYSGLLYGIELELKNAFEEQTRFKRMIFLQDEEVSQAKKIVEEYIDREGRLNWEIEMHRVNENKMRETVLAIGWDIRDMAQCIEDVLVDTSDVCFDIMNRIVKREDMKKGIIKKMFDEAEKVENELAEREASLYSLIEGRVDDAIEFLGKERNILKQENVFLRNKVEGLEDTFDLMDKMTALEKQNEGMKMQIESMRNQEANEEVVVTMHRMEQKIFLLKAELDKANEELKRSNDAIEKYKIVVEKLKKIKDAYIKLKAECSEKKCVEECMNGMYEQGDIEKSSVIPSIKEMYLGEENVNKSKEINIERKADEIITDHDILGHETAVEKESPHVRGRRSERINHGDEPKQGHYRRSYSDKKRGWNTSNEFKKTRDRRN
ncbi:hypothetical protein CWI40_060170 [Ordospora colligata]|nr:hypothetical protein CWI40_060170 [Ordospora colligata]